MSDTNSCQYCGQTILPGFLHACAALSNYGEIERRLAWDQYAAQVLAILFNCGDTTIGSKKLETARDRTEYAGNVADAMLTERDRRFK